MTDHAMHYRANRKTIRMPIRQRSVYIKVALVLVAITGRRSCHLVHPVVPR